MIGALVMILAAIWVYQSGIKAKTGNIFLWVGGCAAVFLVSQVLLIDANIYFLELFRGSEGDANYERDITSVGDRKNEGGFQSGGGVLLSLFMELMPPLVGFLIVAVIRLKFVTKESFSVGNLFSGVNEMFVSTFKSVMDTVKQGVKK